MRFTKRNHRGLRLLTPLLMVFIFILQSSNVAMAAGSAYYTLDPSAATHDKDSTFTVTVHEYSTDQVNAVEADLTYDQSKLEFVPLPPPAPGGVDVSHSAFDLQVGHTNGNGSINISAAKSGSPLTGDQIVGTVTFKVLAGSGSSNVSFAASSQIVRPSDGQNVWNGDTTGGTYSFTGGGTSTAPGGTTTNPTTTPTNPPAGSTKTKTNSTTKTTPSSGTTTSPTTNQAGTATAPGGYYVAIKVVNSNKKPVRGASVTIDNQKVQTDTTGVASFPSLSVGEHTATITAGNKQVTQTIKVTAGSTAAVQEFSVVVAVGSSAMTRLILTIGIILLLLIIIGGGGTALFKKITRKAPQIETAPSTQATVGSFFGSTDNLKKESSINNPLQSWGKEEHA